MSKSVKYFTAASLPELELAVNGFLGQHPGAELQGGFSHGDDGYNQTITYGPVIYSQNDASSDISRRQQAAVAGQQKTYDSNTIGLLIARGERAVAVDQFGKDHPFLTAT